MHQTNSADNVWVRIKSIGSVATWTNPVERLPTYELVAEAPEKQPANLCKATHRAVIIQGETYAPDATVRKSGTQWFNIGCEGSGISKMRLLGEHVHAPTSSPNSRVATLKMLTAKYCGEKSYTQDDVPILIRRTGDSTPGAPSDHVGPIESVWDETGAKCLSNLRLWREGSSFAKQSEQEALAAIRQGCPNLMPCEARSCTNVPAGAGIWSTCTTKHVDD